jgi:hypothetical protein
MSYVASASKNTRRSKTMGEERTPDEFEGFWLNPGVYVGTDEKYRHVRMNRGVAVSDLVEKKIYDSMDPDYAEELIELNKVVRAIRRRCKTLKEGESVVVNLPVVLYRRIEESDVAQRPEDDEAIDDALFG